MVRGTAVGAIGEELTGSTPGVPDEELLAQFLDGERLASEDAFQALVARQRAVYRAAHRSRHAGSGGGSP